MFDLFLFVQRLKPLKSTKWRNWVAVIDLYTCLFCRKKYGTIFTLDEYVYPGPQVHKNCRCSIQAMRALVAGSATMNGMNGADVALLFSGQLPSYYISEADAKAAGWKPALGNLGAVAPGMMLTKGEYENRNGKLPSAPGRIWYEADINYFGGYRDGHRILYSNDGLVFTSYDHYRTFYEIV